MVLARYLMPKVEDKKVLELGCGTGILSIMLALRRGQVLATDLIEVKNVCELNIKENKVPVRFELLDWNYPPAKV